MAGREIVATMWDAHAWLWYGYEVSTHTVLKLYTAFVNSQMLVICRLHLTLFSDESKNCN